MEDGRWKREDGRWKMEEGRGKREEGRGKREEGRKFYHNNVIPMFRKLSGEGNVIKLSDFRLKSNDS
jgi:hypothetical protein